MGRTVQSSNSGTGKRFSSPKVYTRSGPLPACYSVGTVVLQRGTTVKGVTLIIQPPVSAKVKNEETYTSTPPIYSKGVDKKTL
jgi:hypothetical protein